MSLDNTFTAPRWQVSCLRSQEKILISSQLQGQVWPSSGGKTACRCYKSRCLALYECI